MNCLCWPFSWYHCRGPADVSDKPCARDQSRGRLISGGDMTGAHRGTTLIQPAFHQQRNCDLGTFRSLHSVVIRLSTFQSYSKWYHGLENITGVVIVQSRLCIPKGGCYIMILFQALYSTGLCMMETKLKCIMFVFIWRWYWTIMYVNAALDRGLCCVPIQDFKLSGAQQTLRGWGGGLNEMFHSHFAQLGGGGGGVL